MAEKKGFEPLLEHDPTIGFQDRPLQPLGYFSKEHNLLVDHLGLEPRT